MSVLIAMVVVNKCVSILMETTPAPAILDMTGLVSVAVQVTYFIYHTSSNEFMQIEGEVSSIDVVRNS